MCLLHDVEMLPKSAYQVTNYENTGVDFKRGRNNRDPCWYLQAMGRVKMSAANWRLLSDLLGQKGDPGQPGGRGENEALFCVPWLRNIILHLY